MRSRDAAVLTVALLATGTHVRAQACQDQRLTLTDVLGRIEAIATNLTAEARARPNPRAAKQVQAPSSSSADASPVDNASLPELLALAIDNQLLNVGEQQAFSISLNPFAFVSLARPGMSEPEYQSFSWLRRFGGQLTLGGTGDAFDHDGDGKADEALRARELSDSVSWEARVRVYGSRDRREKSFAKRYEKKVMPALQKELGAYRDFIRTHFRTNADEQGCMSEERLEAFLTAPDLQEQLFGIGRSSLRTREAIEDAVRDIDRELVIVLLASGTRREDYLGADKTGFGLRAAWGHGLLDHTFNVDWTNKEGIHGAPDAHVFKFGYQASGEMQGAGFEGSRLSVFAAWERYFDVPEAKHRTVAKAGAKLEVRLADGLSLPVSVTWANHADLLSGADEIVGNVAIALDFSDLRKKSKHSATP